MRSILPLFLITLIFSCNTQPESRYEGEDDFSDEQIAAMHDEVMAVHDEVMPKMEEIFNERQRLSRKLEEINDSSETQEINTSLQELIEADEAMMQWMREFNPRQFEGDNEALANYYASEKTKIEEVRTLIITTLENAASR